LFENHYDITYKAISASPEMKQLFQKKTIIVTEKEFVFKDVTSNMIAVMRQLNKNDPVGIGKEIRATVKTHGVIKVEDLLI